MLDVRVFSMIENINLREKILYRVAASSFGHMIEKLAKSLVSHSFCFCEDDDSFDTRISWVLTGCSLNGRLNSSVQYGKLPTANIGRQFIQITEDFKPPRTALIRLNHLLQ